MSLYLLDTNICIHFLKGQYDLHDKLLAVGIGSCYLSEITIAELLFGVENSESTRRDKNEEKFLGFKKAFEGRILPISEVLYEYAKQKAILKRAGRLVGEFDLLIGTTAIVHNLTLVTRNIRHFSELNGIKLENWIDV
ncbi:type II toxin-antitoxin system VapC family toxin [Rhabdobacter roseus]|uniref:tRNA(fMet)-specific endonuclease VapC n=1 Tax=Rhabdobacter roseus TaxID=1655419 RepID=A0A840TQC4_9BACT|nr:type II toxin-antitoxin system VapC family toxin [Rhabdobacter roseus]MBB5281949.1 tRNA(fMet)-specific endonuclease VapC [Rhabdobacter roseus]